MTATVGVSAARMCAARVSTTGMSAAVPSTRRLGQARAGREDVTDPAEAGRRVSEGFVPLIKQIPGFVAYYWVDAGEGIMASTSVFENRAGAEASTERAADWVRENIASLLPTPPIATAGEVVASG